MATFRSNSSSSTTMTVTLSEIGRSYTAVAMRVNWSVTTGSSTSLGSASNRTLYIYRSDNVLLGSAVIKSGVEWLSSKTYSGYFDISFDVGTYNSGSWNVYIQTSSEGTSSCIWTNRTYCTDFGMGWSIFYILPSTTNPSGTTVNSGTTASFSVSGSGGYPDSYSYQWQLSTNGGASYSNISGATGSSFSTGTSAAMNGYYYRCAVGNTAGWVYSGGALLTVQYEMTLNGSYPTDVSINNGSSTTLSIAIASAGNPAAYSCQWYYYGGGAISGATGTSYNTGTLYTSGGNPSYVCLVTHTATGRTAWSRAATVTVLGYAPSISSQPTSQTIDEGGNVTFTVGVTVGNPSATTYQWQISTNGGTSYTNITGATSTSYSLSSLTYANYPNARFRLYASNSIGGVYSNAAVLTVNRYPNAPTIIVPKADSKTYNPNPYIIYQWGVDADGNSVLGNVKIGTTTLDSNNAAWSNGGTKTTAAISLVKFSQLAAGSKTLEAFGNDGRVNSSTVSRNFTIATPTFTDTITANVTPVKVVHLTELRTMLNDIEAYYGLSETEWSELEVGGLVKGSYIIELRQAAERVRTYINSVATAAFQIAAFTWTDSTLTNKRIKAIHLNELRNKISLL